MTENRANSIKGTDNCGKKNIKPAVAAIAMLVAAVAVFLIAKNPVFFALSQNKTMNGDFDSAEKLIAFCGNDEAELMKDYINLRQDINANYALMLSAFNSEKIKGWQKSAENLKINSYLLDDTVEEDILRLSEKLDGICKILSDYEELRPEITELFDIFNEINRLYTKDAYGENTAFTIAGELEKITQWETVSEKLDRFLISTGKSDRMYLFSYFVKEAQGEATDLRDTMNMLLSQGYAPDAPIRVRGEMNRKFNSVQSSSGVSVNLQQKDRYEEYMYQGMCGAIAENLGEFYVI